ncbi:hypothetical protein Leryth_024525 [Lithospermum erythrorhizon]|nr:hypothetical protein Leryth_024525 [Lithospermum erythrorhizon]
MFNFTNSSISVGSLATPSRSTTSDSIWVSADSEFPPPFYAGFIMCKSPTLICICGVVTQSIEIKNKEIEESIRGFSCLLLGANEVDNSHFLIFGPSISLTEFPPKLNLSCSNIGSQNPIE